MPLLLCRGHCPPLRSSGVGTSGHHTAASLWGKALARALALESAGSAGWPPESRLLCQYGRCVRGSSERDRRAPEALEADRRNPLAELAPAHQEAGEHSPDVSLARRALARPCVGGHLNRAATPGRGATPALA